MESPAATRSAWKTHPLPGRHVVLDSDRLPEVWYPPEDFAVIRRGLVPRMMEDRWFVFAEGERVCVHRSWTGFCIYVGDFVEQDGRYRLQRLAISREPEQYTETDDARDVRLFRRVIDRLILGRDVDFRP